MRRRSSSNHKHISKSNEVEKPLNEEPHLSGAFIRNLVKQLSSSRSRESMNPTSQDGKIGDGSPKKLARSSEVHSELQQLKSPGAQPQPKPKKPVRRRLHTIRPYQERVINMAEARREIMTALKLHRAAMKASEQLQDRPLPSTIAIDESQKGMHSRRNTRIYPHNTYTGTKVDCINTTSYSPFSHTSSLHQEYTASTSGSIFSRNLEIGLSDQLPLCLNLNVHGFKNIDASFDNMNASTPSVYFPSSLSSQTSSSQHTHSFSPMISETEVSLTSLMPTQALEAPLEHIIDKFHPKMGDKEIAAIQLMGEQHDMEWNDRLNLSTSAWWFNILNKVEIGSHEQEDTIIPLEDRLGLLDESIRMSSSLSGQQGLNGCFPDV